MSKWAFSYLAFPVAMYSFHLNFNNSFRISPIKFRFLFMPEILLTWVTKLQYVNLTINWTLFRIDTRLLSPVIMKSALRTAKMKPICWAISGERAITARQKAINYSQTAPIWWTHLLRFEVDYSYVYWLIVLKFEGCDIGLVNIMIMKKNIISYLNKWKLASYLELRNYVISKWTKRFFTAYKKMFWYHWRSFSLGVYNS